MALSERHLVLGAGGFLGRHLVRSLADGDREVTGVARSASPGASVDADLFAMGEAELADLIEGHAVVHHLAWSTVPATADADPEADLRDNVGLMVRLLEACRRTGARLVFASSGGTVYGATSADAVAEDHPLRPIGAYGVAKAAAEHFAERARSTRGQDVRIARLSNAYGPGQSPSRPQGVLTRFSRDALAGRTLEIWGDGEVVRDHLHVLDAVEGLKRLALADRGSLGSAPTFNLGLGVGTSVNAVVALLEETLGRPLSVEHRPARAYDVPRNVLDVGLAAERLGWRPTLSLREGVRRMVDDLREHPDRLYASAPAAGVTEG